MRRVAEESFKFNLIIMKIVGLYPMNNFNKIAFKIYAYIFYSVFTVPVPTLTCIYLSVDEEVDIYKVADNAFLISQIGILIIKLLPFIRHPDDVQATLSVLDSEIFNEYTTDQEKIIEETIATCKLIFYIFSSLCWTSLFAWAAKPFFIPGYQLPLEVWLPFDATTSAKIYYPMYLFVFLGVSNAASSNAAVDTLIPGLACLATGQVRILKDNLTHLGQYAEEQVPKESNMSHEEKETFKSRIIYNKIIKCVKHHEAIVQFVNDLEKTYSFVVFTQFLASSVVICISCYELTIHVPLSVQFLGMIMFIITMLSEIFLFCYYGTILYEESDSLSNAIYMSEWYNYDIKSKKALIILMERSKKPLTITAGKVLNLSLDTFTMILRRSYSFFAVLRNY